MERDSCDRYMPLNTEGVLVHVVREGSPCPAHPNAPVTEPDVLAQVDFLDRQWRLFLGLEVEQ